VLKKPILVLFLLYIWAFSVQANVVHDQLKNVLTTELSKLTGHQIKIEKVEGNLLKRVVLQNVTLFNPNEPGLKALASIKELVIEFNLAKAIVSGGDFAASIKKIMVTAPQINLQRGADKNWNFDFSNLTPQAGGRPPVLNFELVVLEGQFQIQDAYHLTGFKLSKPFEQTLQNISGKVFFKPGGEFTADLGGQWIQDRVVNPLVFTGTAMLDFSKSNLELKTLKNVALAPLLNYVLPPQEIGFSDLKADISFKLTAEGPQKLETQFTAQLSQGSASFPKIFSFPVQGIKGQVTLKKNILSLQNVTGLMNQVPLAVNGQVNLNNAEPHVQIKTLFNRFDLSLISQGMPNFKNLNLAGRAKTEIEITGPLSALAIEGQFENATGLLYEIPFEDLQGQFSLFKENFNLNIPQMVFAKGSGHFEMKMDLKNSDPLIVMKGALKEASIQALTHIPDFLGKMDLTWDGQGTLSDLPVHLEAKTQTAQYFNQNFTALTGTITVVSQNAVAWKELNLFNENQKLNLTNGIFSFDQKFSSDLQSTDWDIKNLSVGGRLLTGSFVFSGQVSGNLKTQPLLEHLFLQLNGYFDDMTFDKQWIRRGQGELLLSEGQWNFNDLSLETGDSIFEGAIALTGNEIKTLKVLPRTKIYLSDIAQLRTLLPGVEGEVSYEGELHGQFLNPDLNGKLKLAHVKYQDQPLLDLFELQIEKTTGNIDIQNALLEIDHQTLEWSTRFEMSQLGRFLNDRNLSEFPFYFSIKTQGLKMEAWADRLQTLQSIFVKPVDAFGPVQAADAQIPAIDFVSGTVTSNPAGERKLYDWELANHELGQFIQFVDKNKVTQNVVSLFNQLSLSGMLKGQFTWDHLGEDAFQLEAQIELENLKTTNLEAKHFLISSAKREGVRFFSIDADEVVWSHQNIKKVQAQAQLTPDKMLKVDQVIFTSPSGQSDLIVSGNWPLLENGLVDLSFKIPGRYFSFLTYPGSVVNSIESPGLISLRLYGPKGKLGLISEKIDLQDTRFLFDAALGLKNHFKIVNQDLALENNQLQIRNFEILEEAPPGSEQAEPNVYKFFGSIDFNQINWEKPGRLPVAFDLQMRDSKLTLDLAEKYRGKIQISNFSFKGVWPFTFTRTDREQLTQQINRGEKFVNFQSTLLLSDGTILVPKKSYPATDTLPIFYDWEIVLGQDVKLGVEGGVLGEDLSNLLTRYQFEMKPSVVPLKMAGYANQLQLDGRFDLAAGSLAMFNRRFELMLPERQRKFFKSDTARVKANQIIFKSHGGQEGLSDQINFSLATETALPEGLDVDGKAVSESAYLLIMDGPVNAISSLSFVKYQMKGQDPGEQLSEIYYFVDPDTNKPMESTRLYALLWDLSPGVLKNLQKGTVERQGVTSLVRDLTSEQANLLFRQLIRPLERGIATGANLYDVKIRHDFSQEIAEIITDSTSTSTTTNSAVGSDATQKAKELAAEKKNVVSVGLVWELMKNRLYFTLNTYLDQRLDTQRYDFGISSYKLTYSLFKELILDEILLSYENEFITESQQLQTYSIESSHRF